jgi:hypothetical protein
VHLVGFIIIGKFIFIKFYKNKFPNNGNNWYQVASLCGTQTQVITNWLLGAIWKFSKVTGLP